MKRSAPAAILLASGLIAGCSTTEPLNKKADFQSTVANKPTSAVSLEVPPDLTALQAQTKYTIPVSGVATASEVAREQKTEAKPAAVEKPAVAAVAASSVDNIHMERAGSQRWLVVGGQPPAQLWPVLKAFLQDSGFTIKSEDPELGVMETDWAENRAKLPNDSIHAFMESLGLGSIYSTSERDMFRIRLEKGENGGTEVYFSHRGLQEVYIDEGKTQTRWEPRPIDPGLEAEMLGRFMIRLGLTNEQAKTAIKKVEAVKTVEHSPISNGTLTINDNFDRAWRRVGLALDRVGLVVSDRDRSQGIYFVKPAQNEIDKPESSGGFWSNLWGKGKTASTPEDNSLRVQVKELSPGRTGISLTDKQGTVLVTPQARSALDKLTRELQ
jgi:outer membrane protein assembly factor BamC